MFFPIHDDNPTVRFPFVTLGLIVANAVAFIWLFTLPSAQQEDLVVHRGFVPARIEQLSNPNKVVELKLPQNVRVPLVNQQIQVVKTVKLPAEPSEIYVSLFSTMFLHGGWAHLIFNMWFLWIFGNNVEDRLGHFIFLCFYLLSGLLATACHWAYDPHSTTPVIGASGAVSAVLGAYIVTWPHARIKTLVFLVIFISVIELPALFVLGFWFVSQLAEALGLLPMLMRGGAKVAEPASVAWWAHIGGFAAGLLLMPLLSAGAPPTGTDWKKEADQLFGKT
jgi:membrane associated rhomboid family serine protease